jgi:hypothetical protein
MRLRAHGRALGDLLHPDDTQAIEHLVTEIAYEHCHPHMKLPVEMPYLHSLSPRGRGPGRGGKRRTASADFLSGATIKGEKSC